MTGYRNSPVVSEGGRGNLTPGDDSNVDNLPEDIDDDEDWNFDSATGGESVQHVGVKRKLLDLLDDCRSKRRMVPANVVVAVE